MNILSNLFGASSQEPARPTSLIGRNEALRINLSDFRKPWWNYWCEPGGEGFYVVGGPKRKAQIYVPTLFPTRAVARSVAKYMTRSARIRVNGTRVA